MRIVSGADLTERAAAPGSLVSVLGAKVADGEKPGSLVPGAGRIGSKLPVAGAFRGVERAHFRLTLEGATDRWTVPLTVKDAAPAIFVDAEGAPLILDAASGLVLDPKIAVYAGSTVQILATGLGKVTPEWPTGVPAPLDTPPAVTGTVTAFLDGRPIEVTRAVLAPGLCGLLPGRVADSCHRESGRERVAHRDEWRREQSREALSRTQFARAVDSDR